MCHHQMYRQESIDKHAAMLRQFAPRNSLPNEQLHNTILLETTDFIVTPTPGSIVPHWMIVWPKRYFPNFLALQRQTEKNTKGIALDIKKQIAPDIDNFIWFEHGGYSPNSIVGCGINFAHFHIIIDPSFEFGDFRHRVEETKQMNWKVCDDRKLQAGLAVHSDYHIFGNNELTVFRSDTTSLGSQFFRKVIAYLMGRSRMWNYKDHGFPKNTKKTINRFATVDKLN